MRRKLAVAVVGDVPAMLLVGAVEVASAVVIVLLAALVHVAGWEGFGQREMFLLFGDLSWFTLRIPRWQVSCKVNTAARSGGRLNLLMLLMKLLRGCLSFIALAAADVAAAAVNVVEVVAVSLLLNCGCCLLLALSLCYVHVMFHLPLTFQSSFNRPAQK